MTKISFRNIIDPGLSPGKRSLYSSFALRALQAGAILTLSALCGAMFTPARLRRIGKGAATEVQRLRRAVKRLEGRGLLRRQRRDDGNEYLLLTEAGQKEFEREQGRALKLVKPHSWDGKWRIIMFDVPEPKKNMRDAMRRHLRRLGCYQLQKSVFVTPYPCDVEMAFIRRFYDADREICIVCTKSLGAWQKKAKDYFGLK